MSATPTLSQNQPWGDRKYNRKSSSVKAVGLLACRFAKIVSPGLAISTRRTGGGPGEATAHVSFVFASDWDIFASPPSPPCWEQRPGPRFSLTRESSAR